MKEKLKNPIVWGSILSTICLILSALGIIHISDENLNILINSILSTLALIGVINVPTETKIYPPDNIQEQLTNEIKEATNVTSNNELTKPEENEENEDNQDNEDNNEPKG